MLQGQQNFLWLGWAQIVNGAGRFVAVAVIVAVLGGKAAGAVLGAVIGVAVSTAIGFYHSRAVWTAERQPVAWRAWLGNVVPFTLALGASQFILCVDMIIVRSLYGAHQTGFYSASGMIGRGLVVFTAPLTAVMFPKIVHHAAQGKKTNLLWATMALTAALATLVASGGTLVAVGLKQIAAMPQHFAGILPAKLLAKLAHYPDALQTIGQLLPWFLWCMLPLALANVLLGNLLARKDFRAVPWLVVTVLVYAAAAINFGTLFVRVVQILGIFNTIFLAVLLVFAWKSGQRLARELNGAT